MTPEILEYLLRLTVIWAVLIAYFFFALRRVSFAAQRFYLLGTLAFGLVVPLLPALGGGLPVVGLPSVTYVAEPYIYTGEGGAEVAVSGWSWSAVMPWLYLAGVAFFGARTLVQWKGLRAWASSGETDRYDGYRVVRHQAVTGPFVAFGMIFLPTEMPDADLENTALIHETAHLRARHHYDTLLLTIGSLLLWFHPLFWMLRRLLATVHEYEADAAVIQRVPVRTYGLQLLQATLCTAGYPGLFSSPIKKRITMITDKNRVRKLRLFPKLFLSLLVLGLTIACSDVGELVAQTPSDAGEDNVAPYDPTQGDIYVVNTPNGELLSEDRLKEIITKIYSEIKYPKEAREAGIAGSMRAMINIDEQGVVGYVSSGQHNETAAVEITIVGIGTEKKRIEGYENILWEEVGRSLPRGRKLTTPSQTKDGKPAELLLVVDFNFILEE